MHVMHVFIHPFRDVLEMKEGVNFQDLASACTKEQNTEAHGRVECLRTRVLPRDQVLYPPLHLNWLRRKLTNHAFSRGHKVPESESPKPDTEEGAGGLGEEVSRPACRRAFTAIERGTDSETALAHGFIDRISALEG